MTIKNIKKILSDEDVSAKSVERFGKLLEGCGFSYQKYPDGYFWYIIAKNDTKAFQVISSELGFGNDLEFPSQEVAADVIFQCDASFRNWRYIFGSFIDSPDIDTVASILYNLQNWRAKEVELRVYRIPQVGVDATFYVPVSTPEEAYRIIGVLSAYDGFQYENRIKPDYCNTGGLQVFDEDEQEWIDWSIDLGDSYYDSVDDYCESDDYDEKEELNAFMHFILSNWKTRGKE